jgi:hypothetical protein
MKNEVQRPLRTSIFSTAWVVEAQLGGQASLTLVAPVGGSLEYISPLNEREELTGLVGP